MLESSFQRDRCEVAEDPCSIPSVCVDPFGIIALLYLAITFKALKELFGTHRRHHQLVNVYRCCQDRLSLLRRTDLGLVLNDIDVVTEMLHCVDRTYVSVCRV